jgi:hypothetical protein
MHHVAQQGEMPKSTALQTWALHCARKGLLRTTVHLSSQRGEWEINVWIPDQETELETVVDVGP